ncbi:MAG TPA: hypothetical protein VFK11_03675 [Candidatus Saccharimonadales bacterium]|nr:hypothetical protein [Candidatus Saccharimonadales bacterium]
MLRITNKVSLVVLSLFLVLTAFGGYAVASAPQNAPPGSSLSQRIAQRKKERQVRLDQDNTERIQGQCTNAQSKLRTLNDSYTTSADKRDSVYRGIDAKLWIIIGSLKLINKDTFKLEQQRSAYLKKVKAFENQSDQFQQAISDMEAMNCKADPEGFQALLETARLYNAQIRSSFTSIKSYLVDHISPTVNQYADELKIKTSTE